MSDKAEKLCPMLKEVFDYWGNGEKCGVYDVFCRCQGDSCAWYIDRSDYQGCAIAKPKG